MGWASLIISFIGMVFSGGAWIWAYCANRQASKSLECLRQFNRAWYYHLKDPSNTKLAEDPASGMFLLAKEVKIEEDANFYRNGVKLAVKSAKPDKVGQS